MTHAGAGTGATEAAPHLTTCAAPADGTRADSAARAVRPRRARTPVRRSSSTSVGPTAS